MEQFMKNLGTFLEGKVGKEKATIVMKRISEEHVNNLSQLSLDEMNDLAQNILIRQGKIPKPPKSEAVDV